MGVTIQGMSPRTRYALMAAVGLLPPLACATGAQAGTSAVVLTQDNRLVTVDTASPGNVSAGVSVSGLDSSESLLGIDFRPAQPNQLFGLSSFGQLYQIDAGSGAATKVGPELDPATVPLAGDNTGFDFNPTVDRIRVVNDLGENYRLNPDTGAALVDGNLAYAPGDVNAGELSGVTAAGYEDSDNNPATGTELYVIDSELGVLATQAPPNDGVLNTVGSLNQADNPLYAGFDIFGTDNQAFAVTTAEPAFAGLPALQSRLFRIDLDTGAATQVGLLGDGSLAVAGLALFDDGNNGGGGGGGNPNPIPLPPTLLAFPLAAGVAGWSYRRTRRAQQNI